MIFYKSSSAGNSFLVIEKEELKNKNKNISEFSRNICNREEGAGADGLIIYEDRGSSVKFSIFNRDGSEAEISGNGMAGLSSLLFYLGEKEKEIVLDTKAGKKTISLIKKEGNEFNLMVEIGVPDFFNLEFFPFLEEGRTFYEYKDFSFYPVSVGNPHIVLFPETKPEKDEMIKIGAELEQGSIFPRRTNVEFVFPFKKNITNTDTEIDAFFYERGAGETNHSSTGSAAIYSVMKNRNLLNKDLLIKYGRKNIRIRGENKIYIENYTKIVYKGVYL
ncbi:MAG: diaminopimelate epimerase [Acidobacteriota bacterium]